MVAGILQDGRHLFRQRDSAAPVDFDRNFAVCVAADYVRAIRRGVRADLFRTGGDPAGLYGDDTANAVPAGSGHSARAQVAFDHGGIRIVAVSRRGFDVYRTDRRPDDAGRDLRAGGRRDLYHDHLYDQRDADALPFDRQGVYAGGYEPVERARHGRYAQNLARCVADEPDRRLLSVRRHLGQPRQYLFADAGVVRQRALRFPVPRPGLGREYVRGTEQHDSDDFQEIPL